MMFARHEEDFESAAESQPQRLYLQSSTQTSYIKYQTNYIGKSAWRYVTTTHGKVRGCGSKPYAFFVTLLFHRLFIIKNLCGIMFRKILGKEKKSDDGANSNNENENREQIKQEKRGLFVLFNPPGDTRVNIDIVAVHGLLDDPYHAWEDGGRNWLRDADFLPHLIPLARIMTYGYNSTVALSQSIAGVDQFAETLLNYLEQKRRTPMEKARPLVFICHSLGGIVVKKAGSAKSLISIILIWC